MGQDRNDELGRLVGAMCDGTITADDTGQLDALLTEDEEARRFYNNYMFLHAELYSQHASLEAVESGGDFGSRIADVRIGASRVVLEPVGDAAKPQAVWRGWRSRRRLSAWRR